MGFLCPHFPFITEKSSPKATLAASLSRSQVFRTPSCKYHLSDSVFFFFFFFLALPTACGSSRGQGSNPCHSSDNTGSLTYCATREPLIFQILEPRSQITLKAREKPHLCLWAPWMACPGTESSAEAEKDTKHRGKQKLSSLTPQAGVPFLSAPCHSTSGFWPRTFLFLE